MTEGFARVPIQTGAWVSTWRVIEAGEATVASINAERDRTRQALCEKVIKQGKAKDVPSAVEYLTKRDSTLEWEAVKTLYERQRIVAQQLAALARASAQDVMFVTNEDFTRIEGRWPYSERGAPDMSRPQ